MADRVTYGPFTLYESEAYKARKKAEETRTQVELERDLLALKKAREEDPDFRIERAGELADRAREIEETLKGYDTQTEINKNQLERITSASTPLPNDNFAGPVMPAEAAMSRMSPIDEQNRLIEARQNRLRSQLEAVDMQRQGLQGAVPLPEGMGSAPAGSFGTVFERRAPELVALTVKAKRDIENTPDPYEREAKEAVYGQMKSFADSQTRRMAEEARKIPGLEGSAASEQPAVMGCYGIGVTRTLQAVIEVHHDKDGIRWPAAVAPYTVMVVTLDLADAAVKKAADEVMASLGKAGIDYLWDDRDERPGVKFKDADLLGFPWRITLGAKSLAAGGVEIKCRRTARVESIRPTEAGVWIANRAGDHLG